jgi:drug/metabolite transporter superfamily protein YnfA
MDIFAKLRELSLPDDQYVVIGSGLWAALGLREANDLDLAVRSGLLGRFRALGYAEERRCGRAFLAGGGVDVVTRLEWDAFPVTVDEAIAAAQFIRGFPFMGFAHALRFKDALGREKDRRDAAALRAALLRRVTGQTVL